MIERPVVFKITKSIISLHGVFGSRWYFVRDCIAFKPLIEAKEPTPNKLAIKLVERYR